jgi:hypothetical protein
MGGIMAKIRWLDIPAVHDYPAAQSYLSLHYHSSYAAGQVAKLQAAPMSEFKAKDIFRASRLPLLGISNSHVEANIAKIKGRQKLSPVLLVRTGRGLIIADGYHRVCAVYTFDEDASIPCKIV